MTTAATPPRAPRATMEPASLLLRQAETAIRAGREAEACRWLRAVLRHDPTNERALLGLVYLGADRQSRLTYLSHLLDTYPRHPRARTAVRWARRQTTAPKLAIPVTRPPAADAPSKAPRRVMVGGIAFLFVISVGLIWALSQTPSDRVTAGGFKLEQTVGNLAPTPTGPVKVVMVSIPLFTATPLPTDVPAPSPTPRRVALHVDGQPQMYNLSCESRSAADLAAYWGVPVNELDVLTDLGHSDNPHKGFVGDVRMPPGSLPPYGYGVYAEPVAATLRSYGLNAEAIYNLGLDRLRAELQAGRPVLVWATYGMEPFAAMAWTSSDGRVSKVVRFMHTFIVTGYDERGLSMLDAFDASLRYYSYDRFSLVWDELDQMAVTVSGPLVEAGE